MDIIRQFLVNWSHSNLVINIEINVREMLERCKCD